MEFISFLGNSRKKAGLLLVYIGMSLGILFLLSQFTDLFSTGQVVFEDWGSFDDRINPPYVTEADGQGNYVVIAPSLWNMESIFNTPTHYSDKYWDIKINQLGSNAYGGIGIGAIQITKDQLKTEHIKSGGGRIGGASSIEKTTQQNYKGYDLKIIVKCYGGYTSSAGGRVNGICGVNIGGNEIPNIDNNWNNQEAERLTSIEMSSSRLNPNIADIYLNGLFYKTFDFSNVNDVNITFSSQGEQSMDIQFAGFKLPYSCQQNENQILAMKTLVGEINVSLFSLSDLGYNIVKFCDDHPPLLTSTEQGGSTSRNTVEIYNRLSKGEILHIKQGDTWSIFGLIPYDGSIMGARCKDGEEYYNADKKTCVGFVKFCGASETWDSSKGTCVPAVSEEDLEACSQYERYDVAEKRCVLINNARGICERGEYSYVSLGCEYTGTCTGRFVKKGDICWAEAINFIVCPSLDMTFDPISGYCLDAQGNKFQVKDNYNEVCLDLGGKLVDDTSGNKVCIREANTDQEVLKEFVYVDNVIEKPITRTINNPINILYGVAIGLFLALGFYLIFKR